MPDEKKDQHIIVRVTESDKRALTEAAARAGKSLTAFLLDAARREAVAISAKRARAKGSVPPFLRKLIETAKIGGAGHSGGYYRVGYELAGYLFEGFASQRRWKRPLEELQQLIVRHQPREKVYRFRPRLSPADLAALLQAVRRRPSARRRRHEATDKEIEAWFRRYLPACLDLVPPRRIPQFLHGVRVYGRQQL